MTRDFGLKESYRGYVPLVSGEIGEDFAYYFLHSEQLPSLVVGRRFSGNGQHGAGGRRPHRPAAARSGEDVHEHLEAVAQRLPAVSTAVDEGMTAEGLIRLGRGRARTSTFCIESPVKFECRCSRSRFERALIALGKEELEDMLTEDGQAELVCHFCSAKYHFDGEQLAALIEERNRPGDVLRYGGRRQEGVYGPMGRSGPQRRLAGCIWLVLLAVIVAILSSAHFLTEYWWFVELGQVGVFWRLYAWPWGVRLAAIAHFRGVFVFELASYSARHRQGAASLSRSSRRGFELAVRAARAYWL